MILTLVVFLITIDTIHIFDPHWSECLCYSTSNLQTNSGTNKGFNSYVKMFPNSDILYYKNTHLNNLK